MLRNHNQHFSGAIQLTDVLVIGAVTLLVGRSCSKGHFEPQFFLAASVAMLFWPLLSWRRKIYNSRRVKPVLKEIPDLLRAVFLTFGIATFATLPFYDLTRREGLALVAAALGSTLAMVSFRLPLRLFLQRIRSQGYNTREYILLGQSQDTRKVIDTLKENPQSGITLLGFFSFFGDRHDSIEKVPYLGSVVGLGDFLEKNVVDELILTPGPSVSFGQVNEAIITAQEMGVSTRLMPQSFSPPDCRVTVDKLYDLPTIAWFKGPSTCISMLLKKTVDFVLAGLAVLLLSPLLLTVALLIKLTSRGPVFFGQTRCGLHGRTFKALKFRTMVANAEALKKDLLTRNEEDGPAFKIKKDPRITSLGRWLRKFSIDELPQLFNVLAGEMSLVGPRPPVPEEVSQYDRWQRRRLSMPPGITCIWPVKGRNRVSFEEWMTMDLEYIDNWSLLLDLQLMLLTIPAVVRGTGS